MNVPKIFLDQLAPTRHDNAFFHGECDMISFDLVTAWPQITQNGAVRPPGARRRSMRLIAKSIAASTVAILAVAAPVRAQEESDALTGNWQGSYVCAQGHTGLTLTIDRQAGRDFSGVFHFYALRDNIKVPEGCFTVSGRIVGSRQVEIKGATWIRQPTGYITVNLHGRVASDGITISGGVITPGYGSLCSRFQLAKVSAEPTIDEACRTKAPTASSAQP